MKNLFSNFNRLLILTCTFLMMSANVWGATTVTFTNKDWAPWTNITSGSSFESADPSRGVANNGVNGSCESPSSFSSVTKIEVVASSNTTGGKVTIHIGDTQIGEQSIAKSNNATYTYTPTAAKSGVIKIQVTKPSSKTVYVKSITITATSTYTVTFNANGGSVSPSSSTQATAGASISLPTPTLSCNQCIGWYTAQDGGTKRGDAGGSYTPTASETVYAHWQSTKLGTPANPQATNIAQTTATLSWDAVANASSYDLYITDAEQEVNYNVTTTSKELTGLTAGTEYMWTVQAKGTGIYCDGDKYEDGDFTTLAAPTSTDYYFRGGHNGWEATKMTKHESGYYSYYGPVSGDQRFKITTGDNWDPQYSHTYLSSGFDGTNITNMGHWDNDGNCGIYDANNYYVLVYHPNTDRNSDSNIKICASSELPLYTAGGNTVYFDNSTTQWSTLNFRIGRVTHNNAPAMTKVSGTANLYKVEVAKYDNYVAFAPANNCGWTGSNSIYFNPSDGNRFTGITEYQKYTIDGDFTLQPTTGNTSDGVTYWAVNKTSGMLSHTATITAPSNGTITVSYTDVDNSAKDFTSGSKTLAHTCNLTITATPATGYKCTGLTVNGSAFTSGNTHVLSADATIAATFVACTVTAQSNNTELGTVSGTTTITASPKQCVGYADPAYTVTGGSATVSQEGNTFTVSGYTTDITVTINFAALAVDTYVDHLHNNADIVKCGSYTAPSLDDATKQTTGACDLVHYHFAGWSTTTSTTGVSSTSQVTGFFAGGTAKTASGTTYYAVWAKEQ